MEAIHESEDDVLERLLEEVGLSDEDEMDSNGAEEAGIEVFLPDTRRESLETESIGDAREARILEQTERWLRFLHAQADRLTDVAARLYKGLLAAGDLADVRSAGAPDGAQDAVIDQLEWTLAALECWIEEQMPSDVGAKFHIVWRDDDGLASWVVDGGHRTQQMSILAVIGDAAETEGDFSPDLSRRIAILVASALRSGELRLMRLRRLDQESSSEISVFELLPRGELYKIALASDDESMNAIPPEVEACLSHGKARVLARLIDTAICEATEALCAPSSYAAIYGASERDATSFQDGLASRQQAGLAERTNVTLNQLVDRAADSCNIRRVDVVRCLFSVANYRLQASHLMGDRAAVVRYGGILSCLAPLVLREHRT
jgi:hypothetical protein